MRLQSYLLSAREILSQYNGELPFAAWLKNYFRQHKQFGSRDRKLVSDLCFCYFRLGHAFAAETIEQRLLIGQFLCHTESAFVTDLKETWARHTERPVAEKIRFLDGAQEAELFPFPNEISPQIDRDAFQLSFLQQPDLFLRMRPGKEAVVRRKLAGAGMAFVEEGACLRIANSAKAAEVLQLDEEAVVQDISSQRVLEPLLSEVAGPAVLRYAWDCCAASGGKTILLHDALPDLTLTVSDIRESILLNLRNRLKRAGVPLYKAFVADVARAGFTLPQTYDVIICDAPCSGSGTWARTPEQLVFFDWKKIAQYTALQKGIALNASKSLRRHGYFLYITCSVFRQENEEVAGHLQAHAGLTLLSQQYLEGYKLKGDTLFVALFTTS